MQRARRWRWGWALCALSMSASWAGIDIQINGVDEPLEKNIREFLSMTRYAARDDLDSETLARLGRRVPTEVRRALEPFGYYSAVATHTTEERDGQWTVVISVERGPEVRIGSATVAITGDGRDDATLAAIARANEMQPGAQLDHGKYEAIKGELLRTALNQGYLDARLTRHEVVVDVTARSAEVWLSLETGRRYRFGQIAIEQPVLNEPMARRLLRMKSGDPYTVDAILESQYLFDDSQYFSNVEFVPGEPDRETYEVPLQVTAGKNRRNRYAVAAGYGTDTGVRGKLTWDNRFVNKRGHRTQFSLTGSEILQEIRAKYIVPVMDVALEKVELDGSVAREELGDLLSNRKAIEFSLLQVVSSWQRVLFLRFQEERTEPLDGTVDPESVPQGTTFLILPGIRFATLPPNLLDRKPRRYTLFTELTGSPESLGSDATFLQFRASGERVFNLAPQWRARLRAQVGITWSDDFDTLPASHRFFAGGDNSVRGFGLNELSPVDPETDKRVGGRYLVVGAAEIERDLANPWLEGLSTALFFDIGNAIDDWNDPLEYSVGVGLRYRIANMASIGVDVAQALSDNRSPRVHLSLATLF